MKFFDKRFKDDTVKMLTKHRDRIEEWRADPNDSEALYAYSAMCADEFIEPIADEEIKYGRIEGGVVGAIIGLAVSGILAVLCKRSK